MGFSKDFTWGCATAAYQIEGSAFEDGRGRSTWDIFSRQEGAVKDAHNGDVACEHYKRWKDDVGLMQHLGLQAYRFSVSWPRVLPEGVGRVNAKGLDFYDKLVDELLEKNIVPYVTLFHWDFPYELFLKGGWQNPDSSEWFAEYTRVVVDRLSDRVKHWITHNEPQCTVMLGHQNGCHAPGLKLAEYELMGVLHNVMLSHGKSVKVIRENAKSQSTVGISVTADYPVPFSDEPKDIEAARAWAFNDEMQSWWNNRLFLDPVMIGRYPKGAMKYFEGDRAVVSLDKLDEHLKIINQDIDFIGHNVYQGPRIKAGESKPQAYDAGSAESHMGWPVDERCIYWGLKFLYERYKKPIYITENGIAVPDWVSLEGEVNDPQRIDFVKRFLKSIGKAKDEGVDIQGYFYWSLMDNYEWAEGYHKRFGLVHVDYKTQKRTIKASGHWYKHLIEGNGAII